MKATLAVAAFYGVIAQAVPLTEIKPEVDERFPYEGPRVPVGDWIDPTINGNGKGFRRLWMPPAVTPSSDKPTNNVNVISLAYVPQGMNIHFQTPFGLGMAPYVQWGSNADNLEFVTYGYSHTYDRTPSCSEIDDITQCSQFFHEVQLNHLKPNTTYYYQIPSLNGTSVSQVLEFTTALGAGSSDKFTIAVVNDMGYVNAIGTHEQLAKAAEDDIAYVWHGGDISYADDWYWGVGPCDPSDSGAVCYTGNSSTYTPGNYSYYPDYQVPLPEDEIPNIGSPQGGDVSKIYETNWDLWQNWMNNITTKIPYMVMPGNHEATCSEGDTVDNALTMYLNQNITDATAKKANLTYYSCPASQRNFTAYQERFRMPGGEAGGSGNFWYSFDYGLAHFVSLNGETDYPNSTESPFEVQPHENGSLPAEYDTKIMNSGPFGVVNGNYSDRAAYEQYQWLKQDLANVDRSKTPWIIAMSHRPMHSSKVADYQLHFRDAFEQLMIENGVDLYLSGHIHWYERLFPMTLNGTVDSDSVVNNDTFLTNPGVSMTHIINGMAGNIESHSILGDEYYVHNYTAYLDTSHFGFSKLTVASANELKWEFIRGEDGSTADSFTLLKE